MNSINKIFSLCLAISCFALAYLYFSSSNIPEGMFEDPKTGKAMLLGEVSIDELKQKPFAEWYNNEFDNYELDVELLGAISDPNQYNYELFLGTWCGDSRREVPRLEKIFIELGIDFNKIAIITVDRDKVSPENEQVGKDIRYVPTLIVKSNDIENICKKVFNLANPDTGKFTCPFAKNSLRPEIKISRVKIIIAAITS